MEEGGSGDVPPADPPRPAPDPPRAHPSTASRLVSGLAAGRAELGAAGLAEQGGATQGNGTGQGTAWQGAGMKDSEHALADGRAGRQDGEQLQCRYKPMLGFSLSCLEHRFLYCGHCC